MIPTDPMIPPWMGEKQVLGDRALEANVKLMEAQANKENAIANEHHATATLKRAEAYEVLKNAAEKADERVAKDVEAASGKVYSQSEIEAQKEKVLEMLQKLEGMNGRLEITEGDFEMLSEGE